VQAMFFGLGLCLEVLAVLYVVFVDWVARGGG
jgi:hypothetical protein